MDGLHNIYISIEKNNDFFVQLYFLQIKCIKAMEHNKGPVSPCLTTINTCLAISVFSHLSSYPVLPHVAVLGLISHQQVSVHLVHQLWSDPAQRHEHLI